MDNDPKVQSPSIGYRRPPPGFRKGQSGNPAGRPKGARNKPRPHGEQLRSLMLAEAYRPVTVNENGEEITLPMAQAVFRSLAEAAAKGEARSQAMFLKMVSESEAAAVIDETLNDAREEATPEEPVKFVYEIVDAINGRPTGKTEIIDPDDLEPKAGREM